MCAASVGRSCWKMVLVSDGLSGRRTCGHLNNMFVLSSSGASPDSLVRCLQRRMLWLPKLASLCDLMILRSEMLLWGTFGTDKLQQWSPRLLYSTFLSFVGSLDQFFLSSVPFTHELTTPFIHVDLQLHTLQLWNRWSPALDLGEGGGEQMSFSEMKQQLLFPLPLTDRK